MLRLLNIVLIISLCVEKNTVVFSSGAFGPSCIFGPAAYFMPVIATILEKESLQPRFSSPG